MASTKRSGMSSKRLRRQLDQVEREWQALQKKGSANLPDEMSEEELDAVNRRRDFVRAHGTLDVHPHKKEGA